jgi:hypothetical protein
MRATETRRVEVEENLGAGPIGVILIVLSFGLVLAYALAM